MVSVVRMVSVVSVVRMNHLKKGNTCPLTANRTIGFPFGEHKIFCPQIKIQEAYYYLLVFDCLNIE